MSSIKVFGLFFVVLLSILSSFPCQAQQYVIKVVEGNSSHTPLFGTAIYFLELENGSTSNMKGQFDLPNSLSGEYEVRISYLGYESQTMTISFPLRESITIEMKKSITQLEDVVVEGELISDFKKENQTSTISLKEMKLEQLPKLMGEADLIRIIQNLPGIKTESDFSSGFNVRGGRNDQNLILLDGVPVYSPWHLFGIFSAFNTEAVKNVELTKGIFPAQYGSRISSVLAIELQDGFTRKGAGYLTVTPFSASLSFGKAINQKTSVLFSLRRTYVDPILFLIGKKASSEDQFGKSTQKFNYKFTDFNAKVTRRFSGTTKLDVGYFYGVDKLKLIDEYEDKFPYNNQLEPNRINTDELEFGWINNTINSRLFIEKSIFSSTTQLYISKFKTHNENKYSVMNERYRFYDVDYVTREIYENQKFSQNLLDLGATQDFGLQLIDYLNFHAGVQWQYHDFTEINELSEAIYGTNDVQYIENDSGAYNIYGPSELKKNFVDRDMTDIHSHEIGFYIKVGLILKNLKLYPGVRYQYFSNGKYGHVLPRLNLNYQITPKVSITAGYGHFTQYLQSLTLDFIRIPGERWFWSDENRPPAFAKSYTAGLGVNLGEWGALSLEGYYKEIEGLLNFSIRAQSQAFDNGNLPWFPDETISGAGEAYGLELFWNKTQGAVTGWVGYTLSWSWNQFEELNGNDPFPTRSDKRHDIQTFWNWTFHHNWSAGLLFNYKSGQPITFSTGYHINEPDPLGIGDEGGSTQVVEERNSFRLPSYHRLDVNITWKNRRIFKHKGEISLNIMNVYNHINTLAVTGQVSGQVLPYKMMRISPNNNFIGQLPILPVLSLKVGLGKEYKWKE